MDELAPDVDPILSNNNPEKIILVLDTVTESNSTPFIVKNGEQKISAFEIIKKATDIFLNQKSSISKEIADDQHQFALMTLEENDSTWQCDFTNDVDKIRGGLRQIKERKFEERNDSFDLCQVFEDIQNKIAENIWLQDDVYRVVLIYNRSNSMPTDFTKRSKDLRDLMDSSNFFVDVLYVHEPMRKPSCCKDIYTRLKKMFSNEKYYVFEVSRNALKLFDLMSEFLAHPLQRVSLETFKKQEGAPDSDPFHAMFEALMKKLAACRD